jgi:hypothetical protein
MRASLLSKAIEQVRPLLNQERPVKARARVFWAAAKNARQFAATDVLIDDFLNLARQSGLIEALDNHRPRLTGEETIRHLLRWASRGLNPFETGRLS